MDDAPMVRSLERSDVDATVLTRLLDEWSKRP